jgi:cation diffusion facilitator CzcD-associated flavoprotein CzcO
VNEAVTPEHVRVVIVGAGFSGIGAAARLLRAGESEFVVLERAEQLGGTWRDNVYPGCRCDVPSRLYSYSFAPDPGWTETFASREEIWDYLMRTAGSFGVVPHIRFGHRVLEATWDEHTGTWRLSTDHGAMSCRYLISATGALAEPSVPPIPGSEAFGGIVMHSARWDGAHRFVGERVAVVGTGASAVQIVPAIQPQVAHLSVFQRTPGWVLPHPVRAVHGWERRLLRRFPFLLRLLRALIYWERELVLVPAFTRYDGIRAAIERQGRRHLARQVPDPELRAKLTPDYQLGCKRVLPSNDFYPALMEDNVELVTAGIAAIAPEGIVTVDGRLHRLDTIVFATGFHVSDNPMAEHVVGRGSARLAEALSGEVPNYLGTTFPGFPNFFMLTGPNTGTGHTSQVFMVECQLTYVLDALELLRELGDPVAEVLEDAARHHSEEVERRSRRTVWASGCASWYQDARGRNVTMWPDFTFVYRRRTRRFDPSEYGIGDRVPVSAAGPASA